MFKTAIHPPVVPRAADISFDVHFLNSPISPLGRNQLRKLLITVISDERLQSDALLTKPDTGINIRFGRALDGQANSKKMSSIAVSRYDQYSAIKVSAL